MSQVGTSFISKTSKGYGRQMLWTPKKEANCVHEPKKKGFFLFMSLHIFKASVEEMGFVAGCFKPPPPGEGVSAGALFSIFRYVISAIVCVCKKGYGIENGQDPFLLFFLYEIP